VYASGAKAFVRFAIFYGFTPVLPAKDQALAAFLAFQSQTCNERTLKGYLTHIADLHKRSGYPFQKVSERWLVASTLTGIRRAFGTPIKKKLAVTVDMLRKIQIMVQDGSFARTHGHTQEVVRCVWAAILIGFFGMLRKQNVSSGRARSFDPRRCLLRSDLQYVYGTGILWLKCRFGKTNQFHARVHLVPLQHTGGNLCPVYAYLQHVHDCPDRSGDDKQPAFMYTGTTGDRTALSHAFLVKTLREMLSAVGETPEQFAGHSLRRGGATLAFALGVHMAYIMVLGDWTSLAVLGYNDAQLDFLQCLPRMLANAAM